jgi:hypothetical protein
MLKPFGRVVNYIGSKWKDMNKILKIIKKTKIIIGSHGNILI